MCDLANCAARGCLSSPSSSQLLYTARGECASTFDRAWAYCEKPAAPKRVLVQKESRFWRLDSKGKNKGPKLLESENLSKFVHLDSWAATCRSIIIYPWIDFGPEQQHPGICKPVRLAPGYTHAALWWERAAKVKKKSATAEAASLQVVSFVKKSCQQAKLDAPRLQNQNVNESLRNESLRCF